MWDPAGLSDLDEIDIDKVSNSNERILLAASD